jgi:hypothetical protein
MTVAEQIATLKAQTRYQVQAVPSDGSPHAVDIKDSPADGRAALNAYVAARMKEGYELAEDNGHIVLQRRTSEQVTVEQVEQIAPHLLERSAWDVLAAPEQDAMLVANAQETGHGDDFPLEWLPPEKQAVEKDRRAKLRETLPGPSGMALGTRG